jgi:iron complex outermembrane recepter protein
MPATHLKSADRRPFWRAPVRLLGSFVGATAFAATAVAAGGVASSEPASTAGSLEEIVVTATRREETISKVPISVTAFNSRTVDR